MARDDHPCPRIEDYGNRLQPRSGLRRGHLPMVPGAVDSAGGNRGHSCRSDSGRKASEILPPLGQKNLVELLGKLVGIAKTFHCVGGGTASCFRDIAQVRADLDEQLVAVTRRPAQLGIEPLEVAVDLAPLSHHEAPSSGRPELQNSLHAPFELLPLSALVPQRPSSLGG